MTLRRLLPLSLLILVLCASSASAATRFAAPLGTPSPSCAELAPCDLAAAINGASASDVVVIKSGTYTVVASADNGLPGFSAPAGLVIRGESAASPPLIVSAPSSAGANGFWLNNGVEMQDVRIRYEGPSATSHAFIVRGGAKLDRVHVETHVSAIAACGVGIDSVVRNSTCLATGPGTAALAFSVGVALDSADMSFGTTVRNSTFVSTGASANAAIVTANNIGSKVFTLNLTAVNSIFFAPGTGSSDVHLTALQAGKSVANLVATNSNYSSTSLGGAGSKSFTPLGTSGNQSAEPLLTNVGAGDLTELPGSPTIDAGVDDPANGTLDLLGHARTLGVHTDIGAYEASPPATPAASYSVNKLSISPKRFRATHKGSTFQAPTKKPKSRRGKTPVGGLIKFTTNEPGALRAHLFRVTTGRRTKDGKCTKASRSNASAKRCTRYAMSLSGSIPITTTTTSASFYFNGRWRKGLLSPGKYLLVLQHTGGSPAAPTPSSPIAAASRSVKFTIVR